MLSIHRFAVPACTALLLSACSTPTNTVLFITKTSIGIDAEQNTPGVSLAYDRVEGYMAPRYEDRQIPTVYASFGSNGGTTFRNVRHVYATGSAAETIATKQMTVDNASLLQKASFAAAPVAPTLVSGAQASKPRPLDRAMFFGTSTTIGIKAGISGAAADNFVFGFKRKEISIIPAGEDPANFPSVVALYKNDLSNENKNGAGTAVQQTVGLPIRQFFATGAAADQVAQNWQIVRQFDEETRDLLHAEDATQFKPQRLSDTPVVNPTLAQATPKK